MNKTIQTKPEPYCPECGAKMQLRKPRPSQHFDPFWGCSQYPGCRGTLNIQENGLPEQDDDWDDFDEFFYQQTMKGAK